MLWSLESASAALNLENAKKWIAGNHSCDGGTQILHKKDALESTSVALEPDWCVRIHQSGAGAAMLHKSGALKSTRTALKP